MSQEKQRRIGCSQNRCPDQLSPADGNAGWEQGSPPSLPLAGRRGSCIPHTEHTEGRDETMVDHTGQGRPLLSPLPTLGEPRRKPGLGILSLGLRNLPKLMRDDVGTGIRVTDGTANVPFNRSVHIL